jgi:hypothetical protein
MIRDAPNIRGVNVIIPVNSENPFNGRFPAEYQTDNDVFNLYLLNLHNWGSAVTSPVLSYIDKANKLDAPIITSPDDLHWFIQNSGILAPDWDSTWFPDQIKLLSHKASQFLAHLNHMLSLESLRSYLDPVGK